MDRPKSFNGFQFHDHDFSNDDVRAELRFKYAASVTYRHATPELHGEPCFVEFNEQAGLVNRLVDTRPQLLVDPDSTFDDSFSEIFVPGSVAEHAGE